MPPLRHYGYAAMLLGTAGVAILFGVPSAYEGPLIISLTDEHAIRVVDAVGLVLVLAANFLFLKMLWKWRGLH